MSASLLWLALTGCGSPPTAADTPPVLPVDTGLDTGLGCSPGAVDAPYDGFDADCDGADDFDADRDGFRPPAFGGTDCNDADPAIFEGAPRVCGDAIDNDCDGVEECGLQGIVVLEDVFAARFDGPEGSTAGWHLRTGDVNGDGYADLLSMAEYEATGWLFLGPLIDSRSADEADAVYPGYLAALGDLDGDGLDDVATVVSGFAPTWVRVWSATTPSGAAPDWESDFTSADAIGPTAVELGDTSGDGLADLVLAHAGGDGWEDEPTATIPIWNSPLPATFGADDIDALLLGDANIGIGAVMELDAKADLTGDGLPDLVVADYLAGQNVVYVVESPVAGTVLLDDEPAQLIAELGPHLQAAVTGDLDGDGAADLTTGWGISGYDVGEAWVHRGPFSAVASRGEAAAIVSGVGPLSLAAPGDLDGDGQADLVVQSFGSQMDAIYYLGHATLVYGPQGLETGDAFVVPAGSPSEPEGLVGTCAIYSVASVGDVDLDGLADFATGSPGCVLPDLMVSSGTAMVILGAATGF